MRISVPTFRRNTNGFFDLRNRGIELLQPGERICQKNLRVYAICGDGDRLFCPHPRIIEPTGKQQEIPRFELDIHPTRQQIRGADGTVDCRPPLAAAQICVSKLEPHLAIQRICLDGVAILHDGLRDLPLLRVCVCAIQMRRLELLWIATAAGYAEKGCDQNAARDS